MSARDSRSPGSDAGDLPGLTLDTLGEIYEYFPSRSESWGAAGVLAAGFLLFTLMVKVATPIMLGEFHAR